MKSKNDRQRQRNIKLLTQFAIWPEVTISKGCRANVCKGQRYDLLLFLTLSLTLTLSLAVEQFRLVPLWTSELFP